MKILVTGGAGYIGSHTLVQLAAAGHQIVVIDNFVIGSPEAVQRVRQISGHPIELVEADICDETALGTIFNRFHPEAVVHFSGLKAVGESVSTPIKYYDVNVGGTIRLLNAMDKVGCNKIVFSSSATVYGTPEYLPYDESHPTCPVNPYGRTKLMVEQILADWCMQKAGQRAMSLRYFNPVGAHPSGLIGEDPRGIPNNLMPLIAQTAAGRRDQLQIFGDDFDTRDGTGERDYVHVMDLADAHLAALQVLDKQAGHDVVNIGTGMGVTVLELVAAFELASGRRIEKCVSARRPGDLSSFYADPTKAQEILGWQSKFSITQMCADAWNWQLKNPTGYGARSR